MAPALGETMIGSCQMCSKYKMSKDKYGSIEILLNFFLIAFMIGISCAMIGSFRRETYFLIALMYTFSAYACKIGIRPERFIARNIMVRFGWHFIDEDGNVHSHLYMPSKEGLQVIRSKISGWWFLPFRFFHIRSKQFFRGKVLHTKLVPVKIDEYSIRRNFLELDKRKDILYDMYIYDNFHSRIYLGCVESPGRLSSLTGCMERAVRIAADGGDFGYRLVTQIPRLLQHNEEVVAALRALHGELSDRKSSSPSPYARVTTSFLDELFTHFVDRHGYSCPVPDWKAKARELVSTHIDSRKKRKTASAA